MIFSNSFTQNDITFRHSVFTSCSVIWNSSSLDLNCTLLTLLGGQLLVLVVWKVCDHALCFLGTHPILHSQYKQIVKIILCILINSHLSCL
jgi:hypothetical protein